jgi:hypothetical protein
MAALAASSSGCFLAAYSVEEGDSTGAGNAAGATRTGAGGGGEASASVGDVSAASAGGGDASAASTGGGGAGEASASAGTGGGDASTASTGTGGICVLASDCPPPAEPCQSAVCEGGACALQPVPEGTEVMAMKGDCKRVVCDGKGAQVIVPVDDETEDDGNPCTADTCSGTTPVHTPQAGPCPGGVCDMAGNCTPVICVRDTECGTSTECYRYECRNGKCTEGPAPAGTLCNAQQDQCNGAGQCVDCVNSGGCGECCVCSASQTCVPA